MKDWVYKASMIGCVLAMVGGSYVAVKGYMNKQQAKENAAIISNAKIQARKDLERVYDNTVRLEVCDARKHCYIGTGFAIASDSQGSFILTNKHVCLDAKLTTQQFAANGGIHTFNVVYMLPRKGPAQGTAVVRVGQNTDLCLLRAEQQFKAPLQLADKITNGDKIFTFGFPNGMSELNYGKYLRTEGAPLTFYSVTDIKVFYGASGSPVVNMDGKVVGVVLGIRFTGKEAKEDRSNIDDSVFVPLELVREFLGGL